MHEAGAAVDRPGVVGLLGLRGPDRHGFQHRLGMLSGRCDAGFRGSGGNGFACGNLWSSLGQHRQDQSRAIPVDRYRLRIGGRDGREHGRANDDRLAARDGELRRGSVERCGRRPPRSGVFTAARGTEEKARRLLGGRRASLEDAVRGTRVRCSVGGHTPQRCSGYYHHGDTSAAIWDQARFHSTSKIGVEVASRMAVVETRAAS